MLSEDNKSKNQAMTNGQDNTQDEKGQKTLQIKKTQKDPSDKGKENIHEEIKDIMNKQAQNGGQINGFNAQHVPEYAVPSFDDDAQQLPSNGHSNIYQQQMQENDQHQYHEQQQEPELDELLQLDNEYDSEDEGIQDYKIGGYHTVHIGEVLLNRYVIIQKIGWGHFSTVWLAKDFKFDTYVALKIQKSAPHYLEAAYDEVEILQKVAKECQKKEWIEKLKIYHRNENKKHFSKEDCQVVQLLNSFIHKGPYGNHFCFVFEILSVNLLEIIKRYNYQGVPLHLIRKVAKQCLIGLDFLHDNCRVIHTDLKPENVLLQLTQQEIKDIVENGQMSKRQMFKDRVKVIRRKLGLPDFQEEDSVLEDLVDKSTLPFYDKAKEGINYCDKITDGMSKNQRKNLKKKQRQKEKRQKEYITQQQSQVQQQQKNQDTLSTKDSNMQDTQQDLEEENKPPLTIQELFSKHQANQQNQQKDKNSNMKGPALDLDFKLKIADLGNSCWNHHHFATEIQTRQYRSPEVIIEASYNPTADIWSLACMLFEMLTGDFLFEPRKGPNFSKNEDHIAQMQELVGKFDSIFSLRGKNSRKYFDNNGSLKRIPQLHFWPLKNVLVEKYKFKESEALQFQDFLLPMLHPQPEKRATAQEMLLHNWLQMPDNEDVKMCDEDHANYLKRRKRLQDLMGPEYNPISEDHFIQQGGKYDRDDRFDNLQNDGDNEDNSDEQDEEDDEEYYNDDEFYGIPPKPQLNLIDRSFTNLGYIGYGDGIDLSSLDNTGNWQFDNV